MAGGRPSSFTPKAANEICDRLIKGESLRSICADQEGGWLPSETTVMRWLASEEEWAAAFRQQYAHAREMQADTKFEQAWDIAEKATAETVQVARLQIDTIKWQTSKMAPKKYGEKLAIGGDDALGPLTVVINRPA